MNRTRHLTIVVDVTDKTDPPWPDDNGVFEANVMQAIVDEITFEDDVHAVSICSMEWTDD